MTIYNFPFTSTSPGNAGPYSAELFRSWVETLMTGKNRANAGVLLLSGNGVADALDVQQTSPASAQVLVKPGAALVDGCWYYHDADETVAIAANTSGNPRIDLIVLRLNATAQTITLVDLQGTPAASPVAPTLTQTSAQYEIPIAQIAVANLFTTITTANITNTVKTFARHAELNEGGTGRGYNEYTNHQTLVGKSGVGTWTELTGFVVNQTASSAAIAAGSWQTLPIAIESNPDSIISVASNQMTFLKGGVFCLARFAAHITNGAAGTSFKLIRLRNITTSTTLVTGFPINFAVSTLARETLGMSGVFTVADNDVVELQIFSVTATATISADAAVGGETGKALQATFVRMAA